jgi:hypothetical protein
LLYPAGRLRKQRQTLDDGGATLTAGLLVLGFTEARGSAQAATLSRTAHDPTISARSISTQQLSPREHVQELGPSLPSGPSGTS